MKPDHWGGTGDVGVREGKAERGSGARGGEGGAEWEGKA